MANKKFFVWVVIIPAAILVSFVIIFPTVLAYSSNKAYHEKTLTDSEIMMEPEDIVQAFYNGYITYEGNPLVEKTYQNNIMLTDDFITYLDEFAKEGIIYDPILCAQDRPETIITGKSEISEDLATVPVVSNFAGHKLEVQLSKIDGLWKIDMVVCNPDWGS